uniref:Glycerophosphodiester phosphodiesterase domain containing 4 n=1 Tax=Molossus molossus TaxID=27622 RepID=A0A7J8EQB5_MOLMO|nr:glycerophosphodiester phosphodiesterase domain containing 4 [Molossus molossus]
MEKEDTSNTRQWKKCGPCMAGNCNHECYITCIIGLYSCHWEATPEENSRHGFCCCSLILGFLLVWEGYELYLHWNHKILIVLVILICTFFMAVLCIYWNDRWLTFGLSLKVFAPYLHLSCITMMVLLSYPVAFYLVTLEQEAIFRRDKITHHKRKRSKIFSRLTKLRAAQVAIGLPFFFILLCLCVVPWGYYSPCLVEKNKLGPKPDLFGHRGAPMLAPENTIMSFEKAVENRAFGLETDIYISIDGVPFLMHDHDLRRTTNIMEVMPNSSRIQSSFFYWSFLSTLNAGKWFVDSWIYWLPGFDRDYVKQKAPGFQQVGRLSPVEELRRENISIINVDYKRLFHNGLRDYKAADITINLYIVNKPWVFSLAWCSRIHSVTTDNIELLRQIDYPYYFMVPSYYRIMWLFLDILTVVFIFAIFCFHWWRENQIEKVFESSSSYTDTESISLKRRKSEKAETFSMTVEPLPQAGESPQTPVAPAPDLTRA